MQASPLVPAAATLLLFATVLASPGVAQVQDLRFPKGGMDWLGSVEGSEMRADTEERHAAVRTEGIGLLETPHGAFVGSLLVPGTGQAAMGLKRWLLYGIAEVALVAAHLEARASAAGFGRRYRDVAWAFARVHPPGAPREEGSWGYYEAMSQYIASGAFDLDAAAAGIQPESDARTYNGRVWELARGLYLPGGSGEPGTPEYERALAYYREHAAGPGFLWSWEGHLSELGRFRHWIERSDEAARRATQVAGLVLANHLISAIDALVVARLAPDRTLDLDAGVSGSPSAPRWDLFFRIRTDRQKPYEHDR